MPVGEGKECGWSSPFTRTSRSVAIGVLLMFLSSGVSCSCFDHRGSGDGAACPDHSPSGIHTLMRLCIPAALVAVGGGAFEVDG
jgi:hypothetical protein